jgi:hypothetical protein
MTLAEAMENPEFTAKVEIIVQDSGLAVLALEEDAEDIADEKTWDDLRAYIHRQQMRLKELCEITNRSLALINEWEAK